MVANNCCWPLYDEDRIDTYKPGHELTGIGLKNGGETVGPLYVKGFGD